MTEQEIKALIDEFRNSLKQIPINITDKDAKSKATKQVEETLKLIDEALDEEGINKIIGMSEVDIKENIFKELTDPELWNIIQAESQKGLAETVEAQKETASEIREAPREDRKEIIQDKKTSVPPITDEERFYAMDEIDRSTMGRSDDPYYDEMSQTEQDIKSEKIVEAQDVPNKPTKTVKVPTTQSDPYKRFIQKVINMHKKNNGNWTDGELREINKYIRTRPSLKAALTQNRDEIWPELRKKGITEEKLKANNPKDLMQDKLPGPTGPIDVPPDDMPPSAVRTGYQNTRRTSLAGIENDFWNYKEMLPEGNIGGYYQAGFKIKANELNDNVPKGLRKSGYIPNHIIRGAMKGFIVPQMVWENGDFKKGGEDLSYNPKKGSLSFIGVMKTDADKIRKANPNAKNFTPGVWVKNIEEPEQLVGEWWKNPEKLEMVSETTGISKSKLLKDYAGIDEAGQELVEGVDKSARSKSIQSQDAWLLRIKAVEYTPEIFTKQATDDFYNFWRPTVNGMEIAALENGFNPFKNVELGKFITSLGPLLGAGLGKTARLLDYGEVIYGWMANGIGATIGKLGTPGEAVSKVVGQGAKVGKGPALAGPQVKGAPGKVLKAGQRPATGSVKAMAAYEKGNFLYGLASGLILSLVETLGVIAESSFGEASIKEALGPDYYRWAEDNGIIDTIGPWPLINSLRQAELEGILEPGKVDEFIDWNNDKWLGVLYEFLGTEGYDDMESINTVWREKRLPQGWFGSVNDVFGLDSKNGMMNKDFIPETGLLPAIKRSPIVSGIEIPFEQWFLPKVGLEDWVIDLDDDYSDIGPGIEQMSRMQLPPEILDENYGGRIDNSMWLKNVMGGDS